MEGKAGWRLSPAYDLNPMPIDLKPRVLSVMITEDDSRASPIVNLGFVNLKPIQCEFHFYEILRRGSHLLFIKATPSVSFHRTSLFDLSEFGYADLCCCLLLDIDHFKEFNCCGDDPE
jgi:hypothetical protein